MRENGQNHDTRDIPDMQDKEKEKHFPYFELTRTILGCCFEVMKELGPGFQERVYKNALLIVMKQNRLQVEVEKPFDQSFKTSHRTNQFSTPEVRIPKIASIRRIRSGRENY